MEGLLVALAVPNPLGITCACWEVLARDSLAVDSAAWSALVHKSGIEGIRFGSESSVACGMSRVPATWILAVTSRRGVSRGCKSRTERRI